MTFPIVHIVRETFPVQTWGKELLHFLLEIHVVKSIHLVRTC